MTDATTRGPGADAVRRVVRTLRDGYWERTEIVALGDGSLRVRKSSNGAAPPGPWGVAALRKEIAYLSSLPETARAVFPPLLAVWDDSSTDPPRVGYEMPFYSSHIDAGQLARQGELTQAEIDLFQEELAEVVLERVHATAAPASTPLSAHVISVVEDALGTLESEPDLARLIGAEAIRLNGQRQAGPRAAFARALADGAIVAALDGGPQVRLHGDLFLENMLWRRSSKATEPGQNGDLSSLSPRLLLIDPVSVAGVVYGPPLFDLVKYESYATGELLALRSGWVDVSAFDESGDYSYAVRCASEDLAPFAGPRLALAFSRRFRGKVRPGRPPDVSPDRWLLQRGNGREHEPARNVAPAYSRPPRNSTPPQAPGASASLTRSRLGVGQRQNRPS